MNSQNRARRERLISYQKPNNPMKFHKHTPVVYCITCKGRFNHISETLGINLKDNTQPNTFFVLLDYSSNDGLKEYVQNSILLQANIKSKKLVVYEYPGAQQFKMAHAKNLAHRLGLEELKSRGFSDGILVNLDADNYTGTKFDEYLQQNMGPNKFMWSRMVKNVGMPRGISGRIAVTKNSFLMSGGYDESRFNEWGCDDKDLTKRLELLGFESLEIDKKYLLALNHNDKIRFKEYPHRQGLSHEYHEEIVKESTEVIVNWGGAGLGIVNKNYSEIKVDLPCNAESVISRTDLSTLKRFPTRIFNVGIQKTATTSFSHAMKLLGFSSAHWESAHWAKAIWREMNNLGHSPTLEKSYCLSDIPIAILYDRLDKAYPGSKFILTIRDEMDWLQSVKDHWDINKNPYRAGWDNDPFSNRLHEIVYKTRDFHAETFLARYRKHNADVMNYFSGRSDFLVLDMSKELNPWEPICNFLGEQIPGCDYPRSFASY